MPTPLGASNLPPPPPRSPKAPSLDSTSTTGLPRSNSTSTSGPSSAEKAEPLEAPTTQGVARSLSVRKVQFDDETTTRDSWLSPLHDDGADGLAAELELKATRAEQQAASAQAQSESLSPVPVKRMMPRRECLTPRDLESRESKRHVAALRLQTLLHRRRAEKAREKTAQLERLRRRARSPRSPQPSPRCAAAAHELVAAAEAAHDDQRRARAAAEAQRDGALAAARAAQDEAAALQDRVAQLEQAARAALARGAADAADVEGRAATLEARLVELQGAEARAASAERARDAAQDAQKRCADEQLRREADTAVAVERAERSRCEAQSHADDLAARVDGLAEAREAAEALARTKAEEAAIAERLKRNADAQAKAAVKESEACRDAFDRDRRLWDGVRRRLHNRVVELQGNIRVFVRVRPALTVGAEVSAATAIGCPPSRANSSGDEVEVPEEVAAGGPPRKARTFRFAYDRVLGPQTDQQGMFEAVRPFCQSVLDGYKVCIFAYGQTGSGKTHTMFGPPTGGSEADAGILQRSLGLVFDGVAALEQTQGWRFELSVEMLEIYLDGVYDLLGDTKQKLNVRETLQEDIVVEHLTKHKVETAEDADAILKAASRNRHTAATNSNATSSRSHCLFALRISGSNGVETRDGVLNLVDLAGSERLAASGSGACPKLLREAKFINSSLSTLGTVVGALAKKDRNHVPYRDSRLTFLLRPSLCGDAKCLAIFNLAPEKAHLRESLSTLRFGQKVTKCAPKGGACPKCGTAKA